MTFYNHIESARYEMSRLVNDWTSEGAETKARISESLDNARREYVHEESENAKLRELCIDLFDRLRDRDEHCGECRSQCEHDAWNFGDPKCVYAKRMRELGMSEWREELRFK